MYADNHKKIFAITNKQYSIALRQNAVLHATVGLIKLVGIEDLEILHYENKSLSVNALISLFPNVGLTSKNGNQLLNTYYQALEANIACNIFCESMLGASAKEQIRQTAEATADTLKPIAVVLFGDSNTLKPITKKFSVLKE